MNIADLKGLGPTTVNRLSLIGITRIDQLEDLGAVAAYRRLKDAFPEWTSLNALWGIQAALMEIDWRHLPEEIKQQLLDDLAD
ncbi:MAG: TfoX/Sxy family DNA transformation protein [Chloroflexi bacterium]|nr:TfoX/Sxy family DNA transformation protein [Chloroflexota bacterium]